PPWKPGSRSCASSLTSERFFVGLDFSGAAAAGRAIWVAEGRERHGRMAIASSRPARDLPGGGTSRALALPAVLRHLRSLGPSIVGCDMPFSLPIALPGAFADARCWCDFLTAFSGRFPDAEAFRNACRTASGGRELRRLCDIEAKVPFCVWNLR